MCEPCYHATWYQANRERMLIRSRESQRRRYQERRAYMAAYHRDKKYGLRPGEYEAMIRAQGGRCRVCGDAPAKLVVDHDHDTGAVRALLCNLCNTALGYFRDDAALARRAAEYLEAHQAA
jgi:recombination endonuclease VII